MVSKEYKSYIETSSGTIEQTPDDYGHYHLCIADDKDLWVELSVYQKEDKHIVEDDWGDFGDCHKELGSLNSLMEALIFAYGLMIKKYPQATFCTGAGCPPEPLIDLVKKELKLQE